MPNEITLPWSGYGIALNWFTLMEAGVAVLVIVYLALELTRWLRRR